VTEKEKRVKFDQPLRVLVVEDSQVDRKILESMLQESPQYASFLKSTDTLQSAKKLLKEYDFDIILLDLNLPDCKGEQTIVEMNKFSPSLAIVVNTGAYEDELGLRTLSLGAQDFLLKGKYTAYVLNKVLHYSLERKRLEWELKKAYEKLKKTQSQLVHAEKMKVVGGLASGIAHEVKNPLSTILYGVTFLKEQLNTKDEKIKLVLDHIQEATEKANLIITDLLDFAGLNRLHIQEEDLNQVVQKSMSLVHHQFDKNQIHVRTDLQKNIPLVNVDRNRIEQVLVNVFLNSVYAMPKGGDLTISTFAEKLNERNEGVLISTDNGFRQGDQVVIIQVDDTGCGIPDDKLQHIFDPFFTTRRAIGGVGLGLAVSKNIMETHKGQLAIANRLEGGVRAQVVFKI